MFSQQELDTVAALMMGGKGWKAAKQQVRGKSRRRRKLDYAERKAQLASRCQEYLKAAP